MSTTLEPPSATGAGPQISVIVIGSTGAIGRGLVEQLLDNARIQTIYSFVRRLGTFEGHTNLSKLIELKLDTDDFLNSIQSQFPNETIHTAFSTLGTTAKQAGSNEAFIKVDYEMNDAFFTAAHSHGVPHAQLISSVGADSSTGNLYLATKGKLEDRLKNIGFSGSVVIYQPGILDNTSRPTQPSRCGEATALCMMKYMCCCFLGNCFSAWRPIDVYDIGYLMLQNTILRSSRDTTPEETLIVYSGSQVIMNAIDINRKREEQSLN